MNSFTFLHLTDLHVGMRAQDHLWPNIQEAFLKDLTVMHERTKPWSAILFSGDLVQSGKKEEYDRLEEILLLIFDRIRELGSEPFLFAVPGNHDLTRYKQKNSTVRMLSKWNSNP